jgi:hypothetical protein
MRQVEYVAAFEHLNWLSKASRHLAEDSYVDVRLNEGGNVIYLSRLKTHQNRHHEEEPDGVSVDNRNEGLTLVNSLNLFVPLGTEACLAHF